MSETATLSADQVRLAEIQRLEALQEQRKREDEQLADLPRLKAEQRRVENERLVSRAMAGAESEISASLQALMAARDGFCKTFAQLLPALLELRKATIKRETAIQFGAKRAIRAGQLVPEANADPRRDLETATGAVSRAGRLWQKCGGGSSDLAPWPDADEIAAILEYPVTDELIEIADGLIVLLTGNRLCYDPKTAGLYVQTLARPGML